MNVNAAKKPHRTPILPQDIRAAGTLNSPNSQSNIANILEQSPACIAIFKGHDCVIELANSGIRKLWGDRPVVGLPMRQAWPELDGQGYFEAIEQVFDTGQPIHATAYPSFIDRHINSHPDEVFYNFTYAPYKNTNGETIGVIAQGGAASQLSASQQIMQLYTLEGERLFREMADAAPVLIWMSTSSDQRHYFNKTWLAFTGRSLRQELGSGWMEGIHPSDYTHFKAASSKAFGERESFRIEYRHRRHNGKYHWMIDCGVPRLAADGTFLGYIGSCFDIHGVKRGRELERKNTLLKKQQAQLVMLNNAKDEFISIASHQLRTPASAVKQYIGLLQQGYAGEFTNIQRKMIKSAYESNQRQLEIIDALLRVAQVDAGKITLAKRTCDIVQLLGDVIQEQQNNSKQHQQQLKYIHPKVSIIASVDQRLLRMVLENLIDNASKYSPDHTNITITVSQQNNDVTVEVRDQGIGISLRDQKKLFQKFSRLDSSLSPLVNGSGLGLYWTKKIIDLHGGAITVESKKGQGSTFIITLPLR